MTPPRIALIHATRVAIDPIETAARRLWPEAETVSILEEGLPVDRQKSERLTAPLHARIASLCAYATAAEADGILFTCSAFGSAIDAAARAAAIPILKPNEAMFEAAFAHGGPVAMIYSFAPAAAGMEAEFREAAARRGSPARLTSYYAEGALAAKQAGDGATHDRLIAQTAAGITGASVILLAQFSMAAAAPAVRAVKDLPVLTSPEAAITEMRRRVETGQEV
ncbi:aspartate/glutamate racemase family protein [Pseudoruegeria sp. SHC-113]|uniref:aspartate/glutamate racemase family protein n=1 Tax=Pseudoruegeria sp. SHC-113 TaxID=2855439 RepID=UPI0021BB6B03|nr:aspartate/glutamate racemase family protein [Pseudoruegeria sp. SHC-113]MCT8161618.1 hypothetical protein [Pseudoruegeria sp. SHC-113]